MAKRFTDTEIWHEDWFISIPKEYCLFWFFLKDACDHAGIWRPNIQSFNKLFECSLDASKALEILNAEKERIVVLKNGRWLLKNFIKFQYGVDQEQLSVNSPVHKGIIKSLLFNDVTLAKGLVKAYLTFSKPLDKPYIRVSKGLSKPLLTLKDKDKNKAKAKAKDKAVKLKKRKTTTTTDIPPSCEDVTAYCNERSNSIDPQKFLDYYQARGWLLNKSKMRDWRAAVRTWEKNQNATPIQFSKKAGEQRIVGANAPVPGKYDNLPVTIQSTE